MLARSYICLHSWSSFPVETQPRSLKNTSRKKTTILFPSSKKQYKCIHFFFFPPLKISNIRHKRENYHFPFFGMSFIMIYTQFHKTFLPRISLSPKSLLTGHYSQTEREPCKGARFYTCSSC